MFGRETEPWTTRCLNATFGVVNPLKEPSHASLQFIYRDRDCPVEIRLLMRPQKIVEEPRYGPDGVDLLDEFYIVPQPVPATKVLPHPKSRESLGHSATEESRVIFLRRVPSYAIPTGLPPPTV